MLISQLEKSRIEQFNIKKKKRYIKYSLFLSGDYAILWYINREKEKGLLRFQFNKGICMIIKYKGYNSVFQLRSVISAIAIEQQFFNYSRFNMLMSSKRNPIKDYHRNNLKFLREKKNIVSKYKVS